MPKKKSAAARSKKPEHTIYINKQTIISASAVTGGTYMNDSNKMSEIIKSSVESILSIIDANTVVGQPITTAGGTVIIPISKINLGFASGGIDYLGKNSANTQKPSGNNFGGGGGSGVTISPIAFLVVCSSGSVELLNINDSGVSGDPMSRVLGFIQNSPELIEKFKSVFGKKDDAE